MAHDRMGIIKISVCSTQYFLFIIIPQVWGINIQQNYFLLLYSFFSIKKVMVQYYLAEKTDWNVMIVRKFQQIQQKYVANYI